MENENIIYPYRLSPLSMQEFKAALEELGFEVSVKQDTLRATRENRHGDLYLIEYWGQLLSMFVKNRGMSKTLFFGASVETAEEISDLLTRDVSFVQDFMPGRNGTPYLPLESIKFELEQLGFQVKEGLPKTGGLYAYQESKTGDTYQVLFYPSGQLMMLVGASYLRQELIGGIFIDAAEEVGIYLRQAKFFMQDTQSHKGTLPKPLVSI